MFVVWTPTHSIQYTRSRPLPPKNIHTCKLTPTRAHAPAPAVTSVNFDEDFMAELERRRAERAEQERAHAEELRQAYLRQKAAEEAAMGEEMQQLQRELEEKRRREEQEKVCALCFALVVLCALWTRCMVLNCLRWREAGWCGWCRCFACACSCSHNFFFGLLHNRRRHSRS